MSRSGRADCRSLAETRQELLVPWVKARALALACTFLADLEGTCHERGFGHRCDSAFAARAVLDFGDQGCARVRARDRLSARTPVSGAEGSRPLYPDPDLRSHVRGRPASGP